MWERAAVQEAAGTVLVLACLLAGVSALCVPVVALALVLHVRAPRRLDLRAALAATANAVLIGVLLGVPAFLLGASVPDERAGDAAVLMGELGSCGGALLAWLVTFAAVASIGRRWKPPPQPPEGQPGRPAAGAAGDERRPRAARSAMAAALAMTLSLLPAIPLAVRFADWAEPGVLKVGFVGGLCTLALTLGLSIAASALGVSALRRPGSGAGLAWLGIGLGAVAPPRRRRLSSAWASSLPEPAPQSAGAASR